MNFKNGPVYAKLITYKSSKGWLLTGKFNFNTEPEQILPASFFNIKK